MVGSATTTTAAAGVRADRLVAYWRDVLCRHSEYYRSVGLPALVERGGPADDVVRRAPITRKGDLLAHADAMLLKAHGPGEPDAWRAADVARCEHPSPDVAGLLSGLGVDDPAEAFRREWLPIHLQRSGGSTGQSAMTAYTWTDVLGPFRASAEYIYRVTGLGRDELVLNLCPAAPHLGIYATIILPLLIGQPNFNTFGGRVMSTGEQVAVAGELQPGALIGLTSYVGHWARTARDLVAAGDVDPLSALRTVICVGESVGSDFRARLGDLLRAAGASAELRVVEGMSSTEMRAAGFYECNPGSGFHVDERQFHVELLDPATLEPVGGGEPGVLVWSHVGWRGHALARYWSGDWITGGAERGACPHCGREGLRLLGPITRHERDAVKFRGARIELLALRDALAAVPGADAFQVLLTRTDPDDPASRERMEVLVGTEGPGEGLEDRVTGAIRRVAEVRPDAVTVTGPEEVDGRVFARKLKGEFLVDLR